LRKYLAKNLSLPKKLSTSLSAQLALLAGLSGLIYLLVFTLPFPLLRLYQTIPPVDYTKLTNYSRSGFIVYVLSLAALFALYGGAIRLTMSGGGGEQERAGERGRWGVGGKIGLFFFIFVASAILAGILIFSYPVTAIDLFIYAIRSRGWALYGLNPLATPPEALPIADPWLGLAAEWVGAPSPYGPLWEWLSLGAFHLSGGDFLSHLLVLKIVAALAYLGCVWLVYRILQQLQPRWAITGAIAFAWNPLTLLESVQNGHNDIVMIFFLLAAIWATNGRIGEWRINPFAHSLIRCPDCRQEKKSHDNIVMSILGAFKQNQRIPGKGNRAGNGPKGLKLLQNTIDQPDTAQISQSSYDF
jgi:hypothetical protein